MIILKKLKWSNLFSYGPNNEIDFTKNPLTQIVGSNGHGKSSIALILEEVLYNKNSKGIKKADILNRNVKSKSYSIELDFEKDGNEYTIQTSRSTTQSVKVIKNGEDISAHTATASYALIQELLGLDHKTFAQIIYQSSATSLEFLTATDGNRKKFLIDLLDLSKYITIGEIFKSVQKRFSEEVISLSSKIETAEQWLSKFHKMSMEFRTITEVPLSTLNKRAELEKKQFELTNQINNIDTINKKIIQNKKYKELLDSIMLNSAVKAPIEDINLLQSEKGVLDKTIKDETSFILKMENLKEFCPTCLQKIDLESVTDLINTHTLIKDQAVLKLSSINTQIATYNKENSAWKDEERKQLEYEKYYRAFDPKLQQFTLDRIELDNTLLEVTKAIKDIDKEVDLINKHNKEAVEHNAKITMALAQQEEINAELEIHTKELKQATKNQSIMQTLVKTFSPTGLVAYKIECLIKDLEEATNQYLADLSGGRFQISFRIAASDKLNVVITDEGKDIEMTALSGGEKARVNTAALLGIRKLMQSISNNKINLLILDETMENLDLEGKERLVELLLKEDSLNTFVISHSFTHPLLERVYVVKKNNTSRIENG